MHFPVTDQKSKRNLKHRTGWHASINSEIVSVANSNDIARLIDTIQKYLHEMNLVNITTAIHRLAKLVDCGAQSQSALVRHPVVQALTSAAQVRLKSISADGSAPSCQALSNIMWSLAVLQIANWDLLQEVALLTVNYIAYFKPMELSTLLWAFSKILPEAPWRSGGASHWANSVFEGAVDYIRSNVQKFTFRNLITAVGAFATIGKSSPILFQTVAGQMLKIIRTANRLELAKTAWAFGAANIHNDKLFGVVAKHAIPQLQSFQQQELSNLLWGFASNSVFHQELFAKASLCAQRMDLNAQQLANILWALTRLRPQWSIASKTMRALMPRCCEQLQAFKPQEFATIAIAAAKVFGHVGEDLGQLDEPLPPEAACFFSSALPIMLPELHKFSDQSLANVATAYTAVRAAGVMIVLANAGQLALTRLHRLDPPLLLQFIRTFSTDFTGFQASTEQKLACKGLAKAFFSEAGSRLERFGLEEQRSLAQLCSRCQVVHSDFDVEDLQRKCLAISGNLPPNTIKGYEEKKVHKARSSPSGKATINLQDATMSRLPTSTNCQEVGLTLPIQGDVQGETQEWDSPVGTPLTADNSQGASPQVALKVKNTFVEHDTGDPDLPWVSQRILAKPPLDFLSENMRAMHADAAQAVREDYQALRAVEGLDFCTTVMAAGFGTTQPSGIQFQEHSPVDIALDGSWRAVGVGALHAQQPCDPCLQDESVNIADSQKAVDTSALRAQDHNQPSPLKEPVDTALDVPQSAAGTGAPLRQKCNPSLQDTSPSASGRKASERRDALLSEPLQAFRKDYQELRAVPGLDWNTQHGPWLTQNTEPLYATSACMKQHKRRAELGGLLLPLPEPFLGESSELEALRQIYRMTGEFTAIPGVDFSPEKNYQSEVQSALGTNSLDRLRSRWHQDHDKMSINGPACCEPKALSRPPLDFLSEEKPNRSQQDSLAVDATIRHAVTLESPPEHSSQEKREPVLPSSSPNCSQNQERTRRHAFQMDALQAARVNYQKLRAVPGLDWSTRHEPWPIALDSSSSYTSSVLAERQRGDTDMVSSSQSPYLEDNVETLALRQYYGRNSEISGERSVVPSLNLSVQQKVQSASPLRIAPSTWLVAQAETCIDGQWHAKRKVLTRPPLDFLAKAETNGAQEDPNTMDNESEHHHHRASIPDDLTTADTESVHEALDPDGKLDSLSVHNAKNRHGLQSKALQAFRKDYQELRAVPGLDWNTEHGPWLAQGSESLYATSACMKQQNRCAELGGLPSPLPFLEENAELETLRQFYRTTGEFSAVPGVDFPVQRDITRRMSLPATMSNPVHITPSRWLRDLDGPAPSDPKALSRPPLDFLNEAKAIPMDPEDLPTSGTRSRHVAILDRAPPNDNDPKSPHCPGTPQRKRKIEIDGVSVGSSPPATSEGPERVHTFQSEALRAFRKDYQELRAVPGLDWNIEHGPFPNNESNSLYATSACMKQHNKCAKVTGLPPALPFVEETAEIEILRQLYRSGDSVAVPGVDFSVPPKVQQSRQQAATEVNFANQDKAALDANPLSIKPSRWLLDCHEEIVHGPSLCEPKALSRPPLDFLLE